MQTKIQEIKEKILEQENDTYNSQIFEKIGQQIKTILDQQKGDQALNTLIQKALELKTSDIHLENYEKEVLVRYRIDGILLDTFTITHKQYKQLLERIKYSSSIKLNITKQPQDGKYNTKINQQKIDIRTSTLPSKYGENTVLRLLQNNQDVTTELENLGFFRTTKRMLKKAIKQRYGMILVTGPTGSGKTTTLYTILKKINTKQKKTITLEEPIEYEIPGITQCEVNEKDNFTFETGLKSILRQDPDTIMVGEIRDYNTLNTATNAALTGHLVLSTLHTKTAADTLERIINMGLPPYILASSLDTIIAQRLVRKICPHCKEEIQKTPEHLQILKLMTAEIGMQAIPVQNMKLYKGTGCEQCNGTGYKGRIGIFEIITLNQKIRTMIRDKATPEQVVEEARKQDMITMKEDGILKSIKGYTTIEEVLRII